MTFHSPAQMRAALSAQVDDVELIEATITQYFAPKPKVITRPKRGPKAGEAKRGPELGETEYSFRMRIGSENLGTAIEAMLSGREVQTDADLHWKYYARGNEPDPTLPVRDREAHSVDVALREKKRLDGLRVRHDDSCFNCGTARGCNCGVAL